MDIVLGIDCGGTHTDAALLTVDEAQGKAKLLASAKTTTKHENLPESISEVITLLLKDNPDVAAMLQKVARVTLGTTLEVNALVENKADKVGLALSAGPGLDPEHFAIGDYVCIVPGGLDHRGVEVTKLYLQELQKDAANWPAKGVAAIACVGKFSPRNPSHEVAMGKTAGEASRLPVTLGHTLSGKLNFPRRIATAYYNAAVGRLHTKFLDSVEGAFAKAGIKAQCRLLKADGGAIPFSYSRREPVQSILSGPAASVMGVMALWQNPADCALLFDIGGTTTDVALFYKDSPVIDRQGMLLEGRRTLVRSLASISIGVGGDSLLHMEKDSNGNNIVCTGPMREGPAMAFGGNQPTLLDALNTLEDHSAQFDCGNVEASRAGLAQFALQNGFTAEQAKEVAQKAVQDALDKINKAAYDLVEDINSRPIYTLAALKSISRARPKVACIVGGPSQLMSPYLSESLGMPVEIAPNPQVANAIGAALTIPTASLEIYADTGKERLSAPAFDYEEKISRNLTLDQAKAKACDLLKHRLALEGITDANIEVVEADLFATLDDYGYGSKDMRVACQIKPGIVARVVN